MASAAEADTDAGEGGRGRSRWSRFVDRARELGLSEDRVELVIKPGKPHGWVTMVWELQKFADWYDRWLR